MIPPLPGTTAPTAPALHARRCARHPAREAVARCPECGGAFCRECVVEHGGRLLCATCLARELAAATKSKQQSQWLPLAGRTLALVSGFLALWLVFYGLGSLLLSIPPKFHDGTVWQHLDPSSDDPEDSP